MFGDIFSTARAPADSSQSEIGVMKQTYKVLSIVGARPQFVKAAMCSRALLSLQESGSAMDIRVEIIHTGQHYDKLLSDIFFEQMKIPRPAANLDVGSGSHAEMTARILVGMEREIVGRRPDLVLVYGDTNSTLGAALAAAKLGVPVAHVEAGLRSFNRRMPEEINRELTDKLSALLFCPTHQAVLNLDREGVSQGVHLIGDVMFDAALAFSVPARKGSVILESLGLVSQGYCLATVHRAENTDDPERLGGILQGLAMVAATRPVVLPLHPRTRQCVAAFGLEQVASSLIVTEPCSFLDMIRLEQEAALILTDSGGVQKEAYFHGVPCVTLRQETEWVETVTSGWNRLAGWRTESIAAAAQAAGPGQPIQEYGQGRAAEEVWKIIATFARAAD
jgi:UDP-GlcNAc3NAcA epimerase